MQMTKITIVVPTLMLRIFLSLTVLGAGLLALLIGVLNYYDAFHPSAFYPSRLLLQEIENFEPELIWGEWKIELPNADLLGQYAMEGWEKSRLFFYPDGKCIFVCPTEEIMMENSEKCTPKEKYRRKHAIGRTLYGRYNFSYDEIRLYKKKECRETSIIEIDCPPFSRHVYVFNYPSTYNYHYSDRYRILMPPGFPFDLDGVMWKQVHSYRLCSYSHSCSDVHTPTPVQKF